MTDAQTTPQPAKAAQRTAKPGTWSTTAAHRPSASRPTLVPVAFVITAFYL